MARRLRSNLLDSRSSRAKLERRTKPFWFTVASGISLGYRRNEGAGSWSVRAADGKGGNWIDKIGIADDHEDADNVNVFDFWQAADKAKAFARGSDASAGAPATVDQALTDYADDLRIRGANSTNASQPRHHMTPALLGKPVSMLTVKELRAFRNALTKVMKDSSVNRLCKALKACFNLAASHDDRIGNAKSWTVGLAAIPEPDDTESNLVLSDEQRRDVVNAAYAISDAFGIYVEVHAATGARSGQIALLDVGDLQTGSKPLLMVPSSLKGKNRRTRTRKPMPVTVALAMRLKRLTAGRGASEPLLLLEGERWKNSGQHRRPFAEAAKAAGLPDGATIYCLRHTAITRKLVAGVPVRLVASSFDTSIAMIEKTYSKKIADHGDAEMRKEMFDIDTDSNVVAMVR